MTLPIPSNVFSDNELVNEASLYARVFTPINTVYALALAVGGFRYGEADGAGGDSVTISSGSVFLVPNASVTFTLATTRRVRIAVTARFQMAGGTSGLYVVTATYVAGASATLTGSISLGTAAANTVVITVTGAGGQSTARAEHSVLLTAGTYTAFPSVFRAAGGNTSDTASTGYCVVYDAGNA